MALGRAELGAGRSRREPGAERVVVGDGELEHLDMPPAAEPLPAPRRPECLLRSGVSGRLSQNDWREFRE